MDYQLFTVHIRLSDRLKRCESQLRRSETAAEAKAEEWPGIFVGRISLGNIGEDRNIWDLIWFN